MILKQLSEVVWQFYGEGKQSATSQKLKQQDIEQYCIMTLGDVLRKRYYENKQSQDGELTDFIAGSLDSRTFQLGEPNIQGMRRALIPYEVVRLPRATDVTNIIPVAESDCMESISDSISLVQPGEENFYLGAEFQDFQFAVQKGKGINTYNLPPCITAIEVERIYIDNDMDIPTDVAFDVATFVLGISLKINKYVPSSDNPYNPSNSELRERIEQLENKL